MRNAAASPLWKIVERVRQPAFLAMNCAHRGASFKAPENTLASFSIAIQEGVDLVECDVRATSDHKVVVTHDPRVERTSNGKGEVAAMTLSELRNLDFGSWFAPEFRGERVPQLEELLELCKGRVVPMIEIKDKLSLAPRLGQLVVKALADFDMLGEAVVIIRDRARALEFAEIAPQLAISMVTFSWLQTRGLSPQNNILGLDHYWKTLSPRLLRSVRAAGMFITPWTINSRVDMQRCIANGCECLLTDIPALLNDLLEELELSQVKMPESSQELATESSDELEIVSESELESLVDQA